MTAAHDVYGNERERAADQKGNQKLSHPLPEPDFCKQFFGKEQQEIKSDRSERTDQRRRKNVNIKQIVGIRGGIEHKSRKTCARSDADARTEQVARQNGKDNGRKRTYEYFGRKTFMRLFKRKRHPGKRRVKGDRKTGARAARHRITAHGRVALQHVAHAAAAGAADHDTRAFAACGKSHEYGEQRCREHTRQHLIPLITDESARCAFRLRNAAAADHGNEFQHAADDDRTREQRQKQQRNKRGIFSEKSVISA